MLNLLDDKNGNGLWVTQLGDFFFSNSPTYQAWLDYQNLHRNSPHERSWEGCKKHITNMVCLHNYPRIAQTALAHFKRKPNESLQVMTMRYRELALSAFPQESWSTLDVSQYVNFLACLDNEQMKLHADLLQCNSITDFLTRLAPLEAGQHYANTHRTPPQHQSSARSGGFRGGGGSFGGRRLGPPPAQARTPTTPARPAAAPPAQTPPHSPLGLARTTGISSVSGVTKMATSPATAPLTPPLSKAPLILVHADGAHPAASLGTVGTHQLEAVAAAPLVGLGLEQSTSLTPTTTRAKKRRSSMTRKATKSLSQLPSTSRTPHHPTLH